MSFLLAALGLLGVAKTAEQIDGHLRLKEIQRETREAWPQHMVRYRQLKQEEALRHTYRKVESQDTQNKGEDQNGF